MQTPAAPPVVRRLKRIHGHLLLALLALALATPTLTMILVGLPFVLGGMAVRVWAAGVLDKGGTLCVDGPYRWVRHPLYLGSLIAAVGFAAMMNGIWGWALALPLFLALCLAQVVSEERQLAWRYGDEHHAFQEAVPRLLPRPWRRMEGGGRRWEWRRVLVNREHYHVAMTLTLAALFLVRWWFWQGRR